MKRVIIFIMAVIPLLTACASSNNVINDDAYYSPYDSRSQYESTLVTSNYGYFDSNAVKSGTEKIYKDYTVVDSIERVVDTVYIIEETPETHVTVELGTGFGWGVGIGYGWGIYYGWDPYWDPYWSPYWYPHWSHYYYPYYYSYYTCFFGIRGFFPAYGFRQRRKGRCRR